MRVSSAQQRSCRSRSNHRPPGRQRVERASDDMSGGEAASNEVKASASSSATARGIDLAATMPSEQSIFARSAVKASSRRHHTSNAHLLQPQERQNQVVELAPP